MRKPGGPTRDKTPSPRANGMRCVSDLVGKAGGAAFRRFGFVQHTIVARWPEIVGARYAGVSSPESIRFPPGRKSAGTLNLVVEGAHATMFQHIGPTIVERVNRFFGYPAIERISFRQGRVAVRTDAVAPPLPLAAVPVELGESLRNVADPELHAVLESLARGLANSEGAPVVTSIPVMGRIGDAKR